MNPGVGFVLFVIIEAFLEALTIAIFVALVTERVVALESTLTALLMGLIITIFCGVEAVLLEAIVLF